MANLLDYMRSWAAFRLKKPIDEISDEELLAHHGVTEFSFQTVAGLLRTFDLADPSRLDDPSKLVSAHPAHPIDETASPPVIDRVVESVRADLLARSQVGIAKYGVTLERTDLKLRDWLQHAFEETLDQANYLKRAIMEIDGEFK